MDLLEVRDLQICFRTAGAPRCVVDRVSFRIGPGEVLGLVGESGCGKSLTALSLMRLVPHPGYIAGGAVLLEGRDLTRLPGPEMRAVRGRQIGMIFQDPLTCLNPVLSIGAQIREAVRRADGSQATPSSPRSRRAAELDRAVEALRLAELPEPEQILRKYPHQLSGGMRQRVMIAMALACRPRLLLADEPTTALDVTVEARILDLLQALQNTFRMAILFITHDLAVVSAMAHRVAVMYAGRIVECAPAGELFADPRHPYTERLLRCRPSRGQRGLLLETIPGTVPDPRDYGPGCRFCDRCPHAMEPCRREPPLLREVAEGHTVACHLYAGGAPASRDAIVAPPAPAVRVTVCDALHPPVAERGPAAGPSAAVSEAAPVVLETCGLCRHFPIRRGVLQRVVGQVRAVDGVDLAVRRGATLALVGESGCGKSTLGKTLVGLLPATAGEVRFAGRSLAALDKPALRSFRRAVQIVFQDPYSSLNPRLTVEQIVGEGLRIHGLAGTAAGRRERVRELLHTVGLDPAAAGSYPHEFSGGQRQRIGIARALAVDPSFLVLDEPTSALDVSIQAQILNLLRRLQEKGPERLTYLFITHDLGIVEYLADEVAAMYLGRIVEQAAAEAIFDDPLHPYTRILLAAIPRLGQKRPGASPGRPLRAAGDVPSPSTPPRGCHFQPRCPHAMPVCAEVYPAPVRPAPGRMVRCHLYGNP